MNGSLKNILSILIALGILSFLILFWFAIFVPTDSNSQVESIFYVQPGQGGKVITTSLKEQGFIRSPLFFRFYTIITSNAHNLQAGNYLLSPSMSASQIVRKLTTGDVVRMEVTIIEGWDRQQIAQELENKGLFMKEEFLLASEGFEGYLFPDTYEIAENERPEDFIQRMRKNFEAKVGIISLEHLVMASILERELRDLGEKKIASGILWKRLTNSTRLQVDAAPETYENDGLPNQPICNPGLESIEAALEPKESQYWYYLSAPDGETIFSRNFEEHKAAKIEYLK